MVDPVTVTFIRPYKVIDQIFTEVQIREPAGKDIMKSGYPVKVFDDGSFEINPVAMNKLMFNLFVPKGGGTHAMHEDAVAGLPFPDWNACVQVVLSFLFSARASSTTTSTAPDSGAAVPTSS